MEVIPQMEESIAQIITRMNNNYGNWAYKKNRCKICEFEKCEELHFLHYSGHSLEELTKVCKSQYGLEISKATLGRHFQHHFIINQNRELRLTNSKSLLSKEYQSSIDILLSKVQQQKITFYEAISQILQSKLGDVKRLEDLAYELDESLSEEDPITKTTGYTATDKHNTNLFTRLMMVNKELRDVKQEITKVLLDVQNLVNKNDQESIKQYVTLTKETLLEKLVEDTTNLLVDLQSEGVIAAPDATVIGKRLAAILNNLEYGISAEVLYQRATETLQQEKTDNAGKK